jgi:signal transduction histidine kinase
MSSKKFPELNSSSIAWFVRKFIMSRMRSIFALVLILILIFERNKIIFIIIEFVYYKFKIIVIFFFYWFFKTWFFLSIFFFLFILTRKRDLFWFEKKLDNQSENQMTAIITTTNEISEGLCHRIFMRWVIWINFSQISDDFQWWWWWW